MKKRLAFLLTLCMMAGLTACGGTKPTPETKPDNTEISKDTETQAPETQTPETQVPEKRELEITVVPADEKTNYKGKDILVTIPDPDANGSGDVVISYGDASLKRDEYTEWVSDTYIITIDDTSFYALVQLCYSNDWVSSWFLKFDGDKFEELSIRDGAVSTPVCITEDTITLSSRVDLFGTYPITYPMSYGDEGLNFVDQDIILFDNEGDPEFWDESSESEVGWLKAIIDDEGYRILTLKNDLEAYFEDGKETVINGGEMIRVYGFNGQEHRFYFTIGGKLMYFIYDDSKEDGYTLYVNGVNQEDMFVMLPYAG